jgi:hypothetical protein
MPARLPGMMIREVFETPEFHSDSLNLKWMQPVRGFKIPTSSFPRTLVSIQRLQSDA